MEPMTTLKEAEDAKAKVSALHDVLRDDSKGLRATWTCDVVGGHSLGVFYDVGPSQTKGLTPIQFQELVRLARIGLEVEEAKEKSRGAEALASPSR